MKTYLVTYAQNATPVYKPFWAAIQTFLKANKAELLVLPGRYKNATSQWSQAQEDDEWWAEEATPYLLEDRRDLCRNLRVFGDISIQPTASRPLSGHEVYASGKSAIFGHPKRTMNVVPTGTRSPRLQWTTGACTVPNYTKSKAGKRGEAHHVFGAVVVEIDKDECYFVRHVTANKNGSFTDLSTVYTPNGTKKAPPAASLTLGDIHAVKPDALVNAATRELVRDVKPRNLVLHDVLDFETRNHHERSALVRYSRHAEQVEVEVATTAGWLRWWASLGQGFEYSTWVVRSNHDEMLDKWLDEYREGEDLINAPYYHELKSRQLRTGSSNLFEMECRRLGVPENVKFLGRNDSCSILGVEHGFHGDKGIGGARGSALAYTRLGVKCSIGHSHVPCVIDGVFQSGVTAKLDHKYNLLPSGWVNAHILLNADGKRQLIVVVNGRYRGGME